MWSRNVSKGLMKHFVLHIQKSIYYLTSHFAGFHTLKQITAKRRTLTIVRVISTQINEFLKAAIRDALASGDFIFHSDGAPLYVVSVLHLK